MYNKYVDKFKVINLQAKEEENKKRSMENGNLSIEYIETNGKRAYMCVFRN